MQNSFSSWLKVVLLFQCCFNTIETIEFPGHDQSIICGPRVPKTKERLDCEQLHRENLNIARCPLAFPVHVKGRIEDIKYGKDMRTITMRVHLDVRWNITNTDQSSQKPLGTVDDKDATTKEMCIKGDDVTGAKQWIPQLFIYSPLSARQSSEDQEIIDPGPLANGEFRLSRILIVTALCKSHKLDCTWYVGAFQAQNHSVQLFWDDFFVTPTGADELGVDVWSASELSVQYLALGSRQVSLLPVVARIRRRLLPTVVRLHLPCALLVLAGWLLFFTPDELAEARLLAAFLALVATIHLMSVPRPAAGPAGTDVWIGAALGFTWLSVAACMVDIECAFRGLEREQHESLADVLFFYSQPEVAGELAGWRAAEQLRRRRSAVVGGEVFFDAPLEVSPAAETVEWSEFYQWARRRHESRRPPEDDASSQWSIQSLLWTLRNISKQYRWLGWADLVRKSVEIMYPVFFCAFLVVYCLLYMTSRDDMPTA